MNNQEIINNRIIYINPTTGILCVVYPTGEESLNVTAELSVPKEIPYWIASTEDIPEDRSFRDAWELDLDSLGEPNGVGKGELEL
jgi:hypothetical protein